MWSIIFGHALGPILAVQAQRWSDNSVGSATDAGSRCFHTLMQTRASALSRFKSPLNGVPLSLPRRFEDRECRIAWTGVHEPLSKDNHRGGMAWSA